jgi:hypothetical protein
MKIYNSNVHIAVNMRYISFVNDLPFASYRISADFGIFFLNNPLCTPTEYYHFFNKGTVTSRNYRVEYSRITRQVRDRMGM